MKHRSKRALLITLFAALQLVLQPLASMARCAGAAAAGGSCCCTREVPRDEPTQAGCCSETPAPTAPGPQECEDSCPCFEVPDEAPAAPLGLPEGARVAPPLGMLFELASPRIALARTEQADPLARARAPGGGPPIRLLVQVFRL
ncbi:MAG: hypothetical protein GY711_26990 [bacterium]|nr:hypothetical protein [bacterium]